MIYVLLGMHKSGTTLTAQLLHNSGINMGFDLSPGDDDYGEQKCEGFLLREINGSLLDSKKVHSLDIKVPREFSQPDHNERQIKLLLEKQSAYDNWGMKNPIQTLTYPFWKERLPEHKLIFVYRSPDKVAMHYVRSKQSKKLYTPALKVWSLYNKIILDIYNKTAAANRIIISYDELVGSNNDEFERLQRFVGTPLLDCRKKISHKQQQRGPKFSMVRQLLTGCPALYEALDHTRKLEMENSQ